MAVIEKLAQLITDCGFDAFAVMPAVKVTKMGPILERAKAEDRYPRFVDDDIAKRINPSALHQNAKSVISLAVSYYTGDPGPRPPLHGTLSRSAWGVDYHTVLNERMDRLISGLKQSFGAQECAKAVDTSFLVDRALAIESGLGYPGSNCCVYVPPYGSWVFLGEVLVDVELPVTKGEAADNWAEPIECPACVQACPTNALLAPGVIRPERCLSYLTQKSGSFPLEFREKLGSRLWGCDTCQQACAQNRAARPSRHREFEPIVGPHVDLIYLLEMDNAQFKAQFGRTSIAWRGKNVLQRNACLVLGNEGRNEAVPVLTRTAENHPSPHVREAAQWALAKISQAD